MWNSNFKLLSLKSHLSKSGYDFRGMISKSRSETNFRFWPNLGNHSPKFWNHTARVCFPGVWFLSCMIYFCIEQGLKLGDNCRKTVHHFFCPPVLPTILKIVGKSSILKWCAPMNFGVQIFAHHFCPPFHVVCRSQILLMFLSFEIISLK